MANFLPIYYKFNTKEALTAGNNGRWGASFVSKLDNLIPAFQTEFVNENIASIVSVTLRKLSPANVGIITHEKQLSQPFLTIKTKTLNGRTYSSIYNPAEFLCTEIDTGDGIYDLKITTNNGNAFYSDIFQMKGLDLATFSCSNANFDVGTNVFSINITRADSYFNISGFSQFILRFFDSQTQLYVGAIFQYLQLDVGASTTLTFVIQNIINPFDTFVWSGTCSGQLGVDVLQFEDNMTIRTEDAYFVIQE